MRVCAYAWKLEQFQLLQVVMVFAGTTFVMGAVFMAAANGMALMFVGRVVLGVGVGVGTMIG